EAPQELRGPRPTAPTVGAWDFMADQLSVSAQSHDNQRQCHATGTGWRGRTITVLGSAGWHLRRASHFLVSLAFSSGRLVWLHSFSCGVSGSTTRGINNWRDDMRLV